MRFNVMSYLIGEGFSNLFKNKKSTMSSLMIMCATMLIFGLFFVIGENINAFVDNVAEAQEMRVFLVSDATESQIEQVGNEILAIDGVKNVQYISKEEGLESMRDVLGDELIEGYMERKLHEAETGQYRYGCINSLDKATEADRELFFRWFREKLKIAEQ